MKNILIFDDEILQSFKKEIKPKIVDRWEHDDFRVSMMYWMKVIDWIRREKKFIRYMWHKKKRIQKKWDKIYNDRYKIIKTNPMMITWLPVV